jgi:hypothetical protein
MLLDELSIESDLVHVGHRSTLSAPEYRGRPADILARPHWGTVTAAVAQRSFAVSGVEGRCLHWCPTVPARPAPTKVPEETRRRSRDHAAGPQWI